jgi:alpha-L-fucosidase
MSNLFIGIIGAVRSGKTSVSEEWLHQYQPNSIIVNYADPLKVAAMNAGWSGKKDPEGRNWLQQFSEQYKREHGEMVFYDRAMSNAAASDKDVCIFGDVRFMHEIRGLIDLQNQGNEVYLVYVWNQEAENRWTEALSNWYATGHDEYKWATHRSEIEWRSFIEDAWANSTIFANNDFSSGLSAAVDRFDDLIKHIRSFKKQIELNNKRRA